MAAIGLANSAGEDLNCQQGYHDAYNYGNTIPAAVAAGVHTQTDTYNENDADTSLVRLFAARIRMGEFDSENQIPWVRQARARLAPGTWVNSDANNAVTETPARLALTRRVGDQSVVLLKNNVTTKKDGSKGTLLPLRVPHSRPFRVAVIGYYANPVPSVVTAKPVASGDAAQGIQSRVFFPAGTTVDPQLTVAMNDESLYGYITKGASTPLPRGTSVRYRSNRPSVVAAGPSGAIRTVGSGVATVTATVTYNGASSSTSFVVYVR